MSKLEDKAKKVVGVVIGLDPATHRRLKHAAIDLGTTIQKFAQDAIEDGIARAESGESAKTAAR